MFLGLDISYAISSFHSSILNRNMQAKYSVTDNASAVMLKLSSRKVEREPMNSY